MILDYPFEYAHPVTGITHTLTLGVYTDPATDKPEGIFPLAQIAACLGYAPNSAQNMNAACEERHARRAPVELVSQERAIKVVTRYGVPFATPLSDEPEGNHFNEWFRAVPLRLLDHPEPDILWGEVANITTIVNVFELEYLTTQINKLYDRAAVLEQKIALAKLRDAPGRMKNAPADVASDGSAINPVVDPEIEIARMRMEADRALGIR